MVSECERVNHGEKLDSGLRGNVGFVFTAFPFRPPPSSLKARAGSR
jgi:hypothetical protein